MLSPGLYQVLDRAVLAVPVLLAALLLTQGRASILERSISLPTWSEVLLARTRIVPGSLNHG